MQRALTCRRRERAELHECLAPEANSQHHWLWSAVVPETTTCTADESKADAAPLWHQQRAPFEEDWRAMTGPQGPNPAVSWRLAGSFFNAEGDLPVCCWVSCCLQHVVVVSPLRRHISPSFSWNPALGPFATLVGIRLADGEYRNCGEDDAGCSRQPAKEEVAQTSLPLSALQCLLGVVSVSRDYYPSMPLGGVSRYESFMFELLPSLCKTERLSFNKN